MLSWETIKTVMLVGAIASGCVLEAAAQGRPPARIHTATSTEPLTLMPSDVVYRGAEVAIDENRRSLSITGNGIPDHAAGRFPNAGNPHDLRAQEVAFRVPKTPRVTGQTLELRRDLYFGVALNGVPFDPGAAEFWRGRPQSGWTYEALGGAVRLGLDSNHAHVQPNGSYHYHGLPTGLLADLNWRAEAASPLVGYAADGFPIYAVTALVEGETAQVQSSYRLKSGARPGGAAPGGVYDGTFVQDYEYVPGAGDLDACNGMVITNAAYPDGTYAYFLTEEFPVVPRCLKGKPDRSFYKR